MRTKTQVVGLVLILALVGSLTACAGSGSSPAGPGAGLSGSLPSRDTKAIINIWGYEALTMTPWIEDGEKALKKQFPNVTINYTYVPAPQLISKLLGTAAAGGAPDGIINNPADSSALSQAGIIGDMSPMWAKFADASQFPESVLWKSDNKLLSIQGYVNTTALFYNKDILDAAGVEPPTTVAELGTALKAVKKAGYQGLAMCATATPESEFQIFPWLLGQGENYGTFTQSKVQSVFSQFNDWISAGYIPRDVTGWAQSDAFTAFSGGKFAFTQNGNWQLGLASKLSFKWGVVPLPAGAAGSFSVGGGEGFSIGAKTKNAALTFEFFKDALLTKTSEIAILKSQGSIPAREDAATDPAIAANPALTVFSKVVKTMKSRPNSTNTSNNLVVMAKIWNAVTGGTTTPAAGAQQVVSQLNKVN